MTPNSEARQGEDLGGLDDDTLVELLVDQLPDPGFYTFDRLDHLTGLPPGTARRLAERAARQAQRFGSSTAHGIRLTSLQIDPVVRRRRGTRF